MNSKNLIAVIALFAGCIGLFAWNKMSTPKIAYVRTGEVVDKYIGMKEARNLYKDKMGKWQANIDTLKNDYYKVLNQYNQEATKLPAKEKAEREAYLQKQEMNIRQYAASLDEKAKEEDDKLTQGVLNQINSYVKEYGEQNGYDLILGTTLEGNVLYGKDGIDVTDKVLKGLNESYGKKEEKAQ